MSDRDEGYCYWMGEPINAMTREAAIEALGKAILIIAWKKQELDLLKRKQVNNEIISRFTDESYLNSFC